MHNAPLKIGLLGAARITPKAVIEPAAARDDVVVTAVAARQPERAHEFARQHNIANVYPSYEALIAKADVDLIYNALPISAHAPWTRRALRAGRHVLCEKPLAMNLNEAQAMQASADASHVRLIEAFHCRFHPAFARYQALLRDPRLGRLRHIDAVFNASIADKDAEIRYRPALGGGAMMDLGCYPVHWVLHSVHEEPVDVQARCALTATGVDRRFVGQLRFASGASASVACDMTPGTQRGSRLSAQFAHGEVLFVSPITPQNGGELILRTPDGEKRHDIDPGATYDHQLAAVCAALRDGRALPVEGPALLAQQRTLDRLYQRAGVGVLRHGMPQVAGDRV